MPAMMADAPIWELFVEAKAAPALLGCTASAEDLLVVPHAEMGNAPTHWALLDSCVVLNSRMTSLQTSFKASIQPAL